MRKKAQGLPLNVIVMAVLALVVLIVLVLIFRGQVGVFNQGTSCDARGGNCLTTFSEATKCSGEYIQIYTQECIQVGGSNPGKKPGQCCIPLEQ